MNPPQGLAPALFWHFVFAGFAIAINVIGQFLVFEAAIRLGLLTSVAVFLSILAGTGAGLLAKFFLDSKFIYQQDIDLGAKGQRRFFLYSLTGLGTTLLFWVVEYGLYFAVGTQGARYIGAVLGLILGYTVKFFLDRALVFKQT